MMPQSTSDEALLKKTLLTVGAMLGATVAFVGGMSLIASIAVGHAVGSSPGSSPGLSGGSLSEGNSIAEPRSAAPALHDAPADPHGEVPTPASTHAFPKHKTSHHQSESL
jgi:hypothetical protein